jgi:DNA-binding NarL/FixJ family response regulator
MTAESRIRVLLADDHATLRDALTLVINNQPDMVVVATAADGLQVVQMAPEVRPDVAVLDVSMPRMNGAEAAAELKRRSPDVALVALTRHADTAFVRTALKAGVSAYVLKQSPSARLLEAIRAVAAGGRYLDPAVEDQQVAEPGTHSRRAKGNAQLLSAREEQVLRRVAWGFSNKEIASQLDISVKTVEIHKANAMRRVGLANRIDIVRFALLQGWLREA